MCLMALECLKISASIVYILLSVCSYKSRLYLAPAWVHLEDIVE
jgi:hypothetical protein